MFRSLIALILFPIIFADEYNDYWCYIQKEYCDEGDEHIGCKPNSFPFNEKAENLKVKKVNSELKKFIVDAHNQYRSQVASGSMRGYSPASKMNMVTWNEDLAETAELFVEYGTFKHDQCRSTEDAPEPGQNIGYSRSTEKLTNLTAIFDARMRSWFNEYKLDPSVVKSYSSTAKAGHFTVMVRDETTFIGCAASSFDFMKSGRRRYQILVACNYQFTNIDTEPTYTPGEPCSKCKTCNQTYKALCEN